MKVGTSVKTICPSCQIVKRWWIVRCICKANGKHKQRQG